MAKKIPQEDKQILYDLVDENIQNHIDYVSSYLGQTPEYVLSNHRDINFSEIQNLPSLSGRQELSDLLRCSTGPIGNITKKLESDLKNYRTFVLKSQNSQKQWEDPEYREMKSQNSQKLWEDPEYREMMSQGSKKQWEDPEFREMMSQNNSQKLKKLWEDPEYREMMSQGSKKQWEDPEFRERMAQMWEDPEHRERISQGSKKLWEDPEYKERMVQGLKKLWEDPEYREMMSQRSKKQWEDPEFRERMAQMWEDPEYREMMSQGSKKLWEDPEYKERMVQRLKKQWEDPEFREMMSQNNSQIALTRIREFGNIIIPNFNPFACQLIEAYGSENGYNFIHALSTATEVQVTDKVRRNVEEENGQGIGECHIKITDEDGNVIEERWVDGYDPEKNVVIEFYEQSHKKQEEKDKIRQNTIRDFLGCEFIVLREGSDEVNNLESKLMAI